MNIEHIEYPSRLGRPVRYTYRHHDKKSEVLTVIFPGLAYFSDAPLMWYSILPAYEAGSDVLSLEYDFQSNRVEPGQDSFDATVSEIESSLDGFLNQHEYRELVFISKSIGTLFVSKLCTGKFKEVKNHIFQTPLRPTIDFMKNAQNILVIVGDSDPAFVKEDISKIEGEDQIQLFVLSGADHLLEIKGNYLASIEHLRKVASETHTFIRKITDKINSTL